MRRKVIGKTYLQQTFDSSKGDFNFRLRPFDFVTLSFDSGKGDFVFRLRPFDFVTRISTARLSSKIVGTFRNQIKKGQTSNIGLCIVNTLRVRTKTIIVVE